MIKYGADIEPIDDIRRTPLLIALTYKYKDIAMLLLKNMRNRRTTNELMNNPLYIDIKNQEFELITARSH